LVLVLENLQLLGFVPRTAVNAVAGTLLGLIVCTVIVLGCWILTPRTPTDPANSGDPASPEE
jgi:hypothetical protein